MTSSRNEYNDLVAGAHVDKPKFNEWLFTLTEPLRVAKERLDAMRKDFDVDTAIGAQLDAVGVRVGVSRALPVTIEGVFFALDDVGGVGLDLGIWKGYYDSVYGMEILGDEPYREVIKSKIHANCWNGTNEGLSYRLKQTLDIFGLPHDVLTVKDRQDMWIELSIARGRIPPYVWELFSQRILDIAPAGVTEEIAEKA